MDEADTEPVNAVQDAGNSIGGNHSSRPSARFSSTWSKCHLVASQL